MALYVHIGGKRRSGVDRHVAAIMSKFDRQTADSDERFLDFASTDRIPSAIPTISCL